MSLTPPYAGPFVVSVHDEINHRIAVLVPPVSSENGLNRFIKSFLPSILIFVFLTYLMFQIVVGCINCQLEDSNLGWIRAAFILNIPLVLIILIFIVRRLLEKNPLQLSNVKHIVNIHAGMFFAYSINIGIYFEVSELLKIQKALGNATARSSLRCSTNHYHIVYGLEISRYCYLLFYVLLFLGLSYWKGLSNSIQYIRERIFDQCIYFIVTKSRNFNETLFKRHQQQILIERY